VKKPIKEDFVRRKKETSSSSALVNGKGEARAGEKSRVGRTRAETVELSFDG
jgi:hypothetical protein